jgi:hypothetical protein
MMKALLRVMSEASISDNVSSRRSIRAPFSSRQAYQASNLSAATEYRSAGSSCWQDRLSRKEGHNRPAQRQIRLSSEETRLPAHPPERTREQDQARYEQGERCYCSPRRHSGSGGEARWRGGADGRDAGQAEGDAGQDWERSQQAER